MTRTTASPKTTVTPVATGVLQRKCACGAKTPAGGTCSKCQSENERGLLQRAATSDQAVDEVPPIVHDVLREPGQPLDQATRDFFEPRFGADFGGVRIHTGMNAAESARAVNAAAYTVSNHIAFAEGRYSNENSASRHLLAHELTHTVQQSTSRIGSNPISMVNDPVLESQADLAATSMDGSNPPYSVESLSTCGLQRQSAGKSVQPCKNQAAIDSIIHSNPRKYPGTVSMHTIPIVKGSSLEGFATSTKSDNTVFVFGHYRDELLALNKTLNVGTIGNCAIVLKGWSDPSIGSLPKVGVGPGTGVLDPAIIKAIAVIYAEHTGSSTSSQLQQKYIWLSMRKRIALGMHGPNIGDVLSKGGYFGMGTPLYNKALADLANPMPTDPVVNQIMQIVISNYSSSIPADAGPFYFHWRHGSTPEACFKKARKKKGVTAEKDCAWIYARANGFTKNVSESQGWSLVIRGDTPAPGERFGSMYIYAF